METTFERHWRGDKQHLGASDDSVSPKHTIFLSHSGAQKPFVEQLFWDLKNRGYSPFFDQNSESLRKGELFPERILQAAKQCVVAVVVLSNEFLTSKWPMLELAAFVDAQRTCNPRLKIFPLFYKLEVADLKEPKSMMERMKRWKEMAATDTRIDVKNFEDAVRALARGQGEVLSKYGGSEFRYRKAIVADICKLHRPNVERSVSSMVGRDRLCNIFVGALENLTHESGARPAMVGLYGLGGMGKTTTCKALCDYFYNEYSGWVCHAEYNSKDGSLELQKQVIEDLTDASEEVLRSIKTSEQADNLLKRFLPWQDVFLALDNIQDGDLEWLKSLLRYMNPKSKVIVTARSLVDVRRVLGSEAVCLSAPTLTSREAWELFIQSAGCAQPLQEFNPEEIVIINNCTGQCYFETQTNAGSDTSQMNGHYNPLVVKAFATSIKEVDALESEQLIKKCKLMKSMEPFQKRSIYDILRTSYDTLPTEEKLVFLDVALFANVHTREGKPANFDEICNWLEAVHDVSRAEILHKMNMLRSRSLLDDWSNHRSSRVTMHDLYIEFARYEAQRNPESERWICVSYKRHDETYPNLPLSLEMRPPGQFWPDLSRVSLEGGWLAEPIVFPGEKLREWENLIVLQMIEFEADCLDVKPLKHLRSLYLQSHKLRMLIGCDKLVQLKFVSLECGLLRERLDFNSCSRLRELCMFEPLTERHFFTGFHLCHEPLLPHRLCATLKVVTLIWRRAMFSNTLDLRNFPSLEHFEIMTQYEQFKQGGSTFSIGGLGTLTNLKCLRLHCMPVKSLSGLENLSSLEDLYL